MFFLGTADLIAASLLVRGFYSLPLALPEGLIIGFAVYLIVKGVIFIFDIGSVMDIGGGILLILSLYISLPVPIYLFFAILLGIKGAMSMIGGSKF